MPPAYLLHALSKLHERFLLPRMAGSQSKLSVPRSVPKPDWSRPKYRIAINRSQLPGRSRICASCNCTWQDERNNLMRSLLLSFCLLKNVTLAISCLGASAPHIWEGLGRTFLSTRTQLVILAPLCSAFLRILRVGGSADTKCPTG